MTTNNSPCDSCIHKWECWDQRGYCNQYKSKEEVIKEIESLNANQATSSESAVPTDKTTEE